jgi:electron transfer flavoprotein alpha/beta subunit
MAAKKKEIRKAAAAAGAAPRQKIVSLYAPQKAKKTHIISGSAQEAAKELVKKLRDEARVI